MQSSTDANREAQRGLLHRLMQSQFATQEELATLKRLAGLVETSGPDKLLKVSNHLHKLSNAIGKRRDAYRPLDIVC